MGLSESGSSLKSQMHLASLLFEKNPEDPVELEETLEEALDIAERCLPKSEQMFGPASLSTASFRETRNRCLFKLGREEEMAELAAKWYSKCKDTFAEPSIITVVAANNLGQCYTRLGRRKEACELYERNHEPLVKLHGDKSPATLHNLIYLCNEHACLGNYDSAVIYASKVVEHMPDELPQRAVLLREANVIIGERLCEQGQFEEGKRILEAILDSSDNQDCIHRRLFALRAKSALALCEIADGNQDDALVTLKIARAGMKELEEELGTLAGYAWILERCEQRLAKLEKTGESKDAEE